MLFSALFEAVYKHSQTLAKEDIVTALLATMLDQSPDLRSFLLSHESIGCPSAIIRSIVPDAHIRTGITDLVVNGPQGEQVTIRPDLLIASDQCPSTQDSRFVLIESKLFSPLTPNQYCGYPEIKRQYGDSCFIMLISNYKNPEMSCVFDITLSWNHVHSLLTSYVKSIPTPTPESIVLRELLLTFSSIGVQLNSFIDIEIEKNQPPVDYIDIPTFVKAMRKSMGMTQEQFAKEAKVGLRFLRDLEQGKKESLRSDKVNQVLERFGCVLAPVRRSQNLTNPPHPALEAHAR